MTPISKPHDAAPRSTSAPCLIKWHPIAAWSEAQVYAWHAEQRVPLHEAYTRWKASRMGCSFCVLASLHNLETSTAVPGNGAAYNLLVDLEITTHFSFQPSRWLADVAPALLGARRRAQLAHAKASAARRRQLEACLPDGLRFQRGWPPRIPTRIEAATIAAVRAEILAQHALPNQFPSAADVIDRFAELHTAHAAA